MKEEKNKYYTPEISEFHVGFEYQYKNKNKWLKTIFQDGRSVEYHEEQRVKYLDKEDIRDLGWRYNGLFFEYAESSLSEDNDRVIIYDVSDNVIFNGKIKNKSELKKIMKMLQII